MSDQTRPAAYRLVDGTRWQAPTDRAARHREPGVLPVAVGDLTGAGDHLRRWPAGRRPPRVAVVTDEARLGDEAVNVLRGTPARSPDLRQQTEMRIRHCSSPAASVRDYVDLARHCSARSLAAAVDALADDPGCDAVVITLGRTSVARAQTMTHALARVCRDHPDTTVVMVSPTRIDPPSPPDA
jgi:hypothetical protein